MTIEIHDVKDYQDAAPWRSFDLYSEGNTLDELLDRAVYIMTDQDGGSLGEIEADDDLAERLIIDKWNEQTFGKVLIFPLRGAK